MVFLMKKFLKIGIDVDDVLFSCNEYAIELANKEFHFDPPLSIQECTKWGFKDSRAEVLLHYYKRADFVRSQPVLPGAAEFVKKVQKKAEVFFITSVPPALMGIRAERLIEEFPFVPEKNIIMGYRKDLVNLDIILDDGAHNINTSNSLYPVLFRKPWNVNMSGCLSVNNYDEFIALLDTILQNNDNEKKERKIIAIVGPSGSGKTMMVNKVSEMGLIKKVPSYTTRERRKNEAVDDYHFISKEEFVRLERDGFFFETTRYAGECYGSAKSDVMKIWDSGITPVSIVDICGAIAIRKEFPDEAMLVYVKRPKRLLVESILERDISRVDKTNRILSLEDEAKNEELCDYTIENNASINHAVTQFLFNVL